MKEQDQSVQEDVPLPKTGGQNEEHKGDPFNGDVFSPIGNSNRTQVIIAFSIYIPSILLFVTCGIVNMCYANADTHVHWILTTSFVKGGRKQDGVFLMVKGMLFFLFTLYVVLCFVLGVFLCLRGKVIKAQDMYHMAYSIYGRWLGFIIIIASALPLIAICFDALQDDKKTLKTVRKCLISGFVFNFFCIVGFGFLRFVFKDANEFFSFYYKKVFISFALGYHIYYFFDNIMDLAEYDDVIRHRSARYRTSREKGSWICMLLFGIIIAVIGGIGKDLVICFFGSFVEMGFMVISAKDKKRKKQGNRITGNLVVSSIFFCLLIIEMVILGLLFGKRIIN
ncbi:MAG: hypothetical protein MJ252_13805 [archaeon]|nr:hypothetical protein [archaeon]